MVGSIGGWALWTGPTPEGGNWSKFVGRSPASPPEVTGFNWNPSGPGAGRPARSWLAVGPCGEKRPAIWAANQPFNRPDCSACFDIFQRSASRCRHRPRDVVGHSASPSSELAGCLVAVRDARQTQPGHQAARFLLSGLRVSQPNTSLMRGQRFPPLTGRARVHCRDEEAVRG